MRFLVLSLFLSVSSGFAAEYAVFSNGSRLHVDRHEIEGARVRLYIGEGYTEMEVARIQGFEADETPAGQPPAAAERPKVPPPPPSPAELADAAADRYGLPRKLVRSVMSAESGFQTGATSPRGAIGLMQLMPSTAQQLGADPHDAAQNVDAGTRYLRDLLVRYNYGLWHALAAYNAGPGAVDRYKAIPPYRETINYINRIDKSFRTEARDAGGATP